MVKNVQYNAYVEFRDRACKMSNLSAGRERELIRQYKRHNDLQARDEVVYAYLKFALSVAEKYVRKKGNETYYIENISDYAQQAIEGLLRSMKKYDWNSEVSFATYTYIWIMKYIYQYERIHMPIPITEKVHLKLFRLRDAENSYAVEDCEKPSLEWLSDQTGLKESELQSLMNTRKMITEDMVPLQELTAEKDPKAAGYFEAIEEKLVMQEILCDLMEKGAADVELMIVNEILSDKGIVSGHDLASRIHRSVSTVKYHIRKLRGYFRYLQSVRNIG